VEVFIKGDIFWEKVIIIILISDVYDDIFYMRISFYQVWKHWVDDSYCLVYWYFSRKFI